MKTFLFAFLLVNLPVFAADSSKTVEVLKDCEARADVIGAHPITLKQGAKFPVLEEKIGYLIIGVGADRIRVASNQVRIFSMSEREKAELARKESGTQRRNVDAVSSKEAELSTVTEPDQSEIKSVSDTDVNVPSIQDNAKSNQNGLPFPTNEASPTKLVPQENWHKRVGQEMKMCEELYKGLSPSTVSDSSLEVASYPEIYKGVTLMMPLLEALRVLNLGADLSRSQSIIPHTTSKTLVTPVSCLIPAKSPISHAGIPFFFRSFDLNKLPKSERPVEGVDTFNLLYVITDAADRVVGILLLCEAPHASVGPNTNFTSYNFVLNRHKTVDFLKVRFELDAHNGSSLLVVNTWLIDLKRHKCLEIVKWYLPTKIGNFIKHVLEIKLGLAPAIAPPQK